MKNETRRAIATSRGWPEVERAIELWVQITEVPTRWLDRLIYSKDRHIMCDSDRGRS